MYLHEAGVNDLHPTGLTTTEWFELALAAWFHDGMLFAFAPHVTGANEMQEELKRSLTPLNAAFDASAYKPRTKAKPIAAR